MNKLPRLVYVVTARSRLDMHSQIQSESHIESTKRFDSIHDAMSELNRLVNVCGWRDVDLVAMSVTD